MASDQLSQDAQDALFDDANIKNDEQRIWNKISHAYSINEFLGKGSYG